jgi:hypothetical protein
MKHARFLMPCVIVSAQVAMFVAMGSGYPVTRVLAESSSLNMLYAFQAWARDNKVPNASFVATQNAQEVISAGDPGILIPSLLLPRIRRQSPRSAS